MQDREALISQLRDIGVPEVSATPAIGWWVLIGLFLLSLLLYQLKRLRTKKSIWKIQAEQQLKTIRDSVGQESSSHTIAQCSQLARQVVLAVDQREQVAALHGNAWLDKLDEMCGRPEFSHGIGQLLLDQPYKKTPTVEEQDLHALVDSMQVLIKSADVRKRRAR